MVDTANPKEYWGERAERYDNLHWVKNRLFLDRILVNGKFLGSDKVLDVGTGTGVVAAIVAPFVRWVAAIDTSSDMMGKARGNGCPGNVSFLVGDARKMFFADAVFDKIVARYCLHHIIEGVEKAASECYRVLKPGGLMIFAEGVPPSARAKDYFTRIFELKEKRIVFLPEDMELLLTGAGFQKLTTDVFWLKRMSVRNWLESSDLDKDRKELIYQLHCTAPEFVKQDYQMTEKDGDCLIDMRVAIVVGKKAAQ